MSVHTGKKNAAKEKTSVHIFIFIMMTDMKEEVDIKVVTVLTEELIEIGLVMEEDMKVKFFFVNSMPENQGHSMSLYFQTP